MEFYWKCCRYNEISTTSLCTTFRTRKRTSELVAERRDDGSVVIHSIALRRQLNLAGRYQKAEALCMLLQRYINGLEPGTATLRTHTVEAGHE